MVEIRSPKRDLHVAIFGRDPGVRLSVEAIVRADDDLAWADSLDSVEATIGLCESDRVDVLLIDSDSDPDWKLCLMLTRLFPRLTVIGLLGAGSRSPVSSSWALLHGARGIVGLDAETDQLCLAIKGAVRSGHYVDPGLETSSAPATQPGPWPGKPLSAREYEVLLLIADGRTAEQIGRRLGIAADTVRTHVCRTLRKLEARDRAHAVALAYQRCLLPRGPFPPTRATVATRGAGRVHELGRPS